jgi:hypothetical protein
VNIRDEAKNSGKVLTQSKPGDTFIAEEKQETNSVDGSKWYKIVMSVGSDYVPLEKDARFGVSVAYISANNAHTMRAAESENKKIAALLTGATATGAAATPAESTKTETIKTIKVSNAREFLEALGSDRIIEMAAGDYNLSIWDPIFNNQPEQAPHYPNLKADGEPKLESGVSWSDDPFDGGELVLNGIRNLTIKGWTGQSDGKTLIIVDPRYAFVLKFVNSSNITIENLTAGHSEGGYCQGGVFGFEDSSQINITGSNMYGCGTEGLVLSNTRDMKVTGSRIYECTYSIMTVTGGQNIAFEKCVFSDNQEFSLVNVEKTGKMSFTNCEFTDNRGSSMFFINDTTVSVVNSTFSGNITGEPIEYSGNVEFENCTFETASAPAGNVEENDDEKSENLTLKDDYTGNTIKLYPPFYSEEVKGFLAAYDNARFGYSVLIPSQVFTEVVLFPDNEDGIILASKEDGYRFRVSGGHVIDEDIYKTSMEEAKKHVEENVEGAMITEKTGDGWWELSWWNGPEKGVRRFITNGEIWCECEITWPGLPHNAPGEYDELFEHSLQSLSLSVG